MTGGNIHYRRRCRRAKGTRNPLQPHMVQVTVQLDEDSFNQIADIAHSKQISFAEMVRTYIEWGILNEEERKAA